MSRIVDVVNATFSWDADTRLEYGDDFAGGVLYALDKLCEHEEAVVRCKDCTEHQKCRLEQWLGWYGYCSEGERRNDGEET